MSTRTPHKSFAGNSLGAELTDRSLLSHVVIYNLKLQQLQRADSNSHKTGMCGGTHSRARLASLSSRAGDFHLRRTEVLAQAKIHLHFTNASLHTPKWTIDTPKKIEPGTLRPVQFLKHLRLFQFVEPCCGRNMHVLNQVTGIQTC